MAIFHADLAARSVPRYTSYPTAAEFTETVGAAEHRAALDALRPRDRISLYLHIPYCHEICWYCGCNTGPVGRASRLDVYVEALVAEIGMVADRAKGSVSHVHFGGGSPNALSPAQFEQWVVAPTARIVAALRERHPGVPVIGFPKGAGSKLAAYASETGVNAIGLDETVDPMWAAKELPAALPIQGNLDPLALIAGGTDLKSAVKRILDAFAGRPHIFNLGHGILQDTPIANVERLIALVKGDK